MADSGRKKLQSQFDTAVNSNPQFKKELERRIKYARSQGASLAEQSKEELRYKLLELEKELANANRHIEKLGEELRMKELAGIAGDGNVLLGQLRISNLQLQAEKENLELALKELQRAYSKLITEASSKKLTR